MKKTPNPATPSPTLRRPVHRGVVYGSAFVSGFSVMAIEILGGRMISPWFGADIYVWGSIITVFMLALSLGYLQGGRLTRQGAALSRYGRVFLVAAALLCLVVLIAKPVSSVLFDWVSDPRYGSLLIALVLFLPPSWALGIVSPYSVRLLTRSVEDSGSAAGTLYFVSTLGSALGTLLTAFYLIVLFEVNTILYATATVLLLNGLLLCILARVEDTHAALRQKKTPTEPGRRPSVARARRRAV